MANVFDKDPDAVLDYEWDWTNWILAGDFIETVTIVADTGLTVNSYSFTNTKVTVWLSGGVNGQVYKVVCRIVTSIGRSEDRTMMIVCKTR